MEERKEALIQRALGRRSNIELCVHGINKYYCTHCAAKKAAKPSKAKTAAAAAAAVADTEKPATTTE